MDLNRLGWLVFILTQLSMLGVYIFIFSRVARRSTDLVTAAKPFAWVIIAVVTVGNVAAAVLWALGNPEVEPWPMVLFGLFFIVLGATAVMLILRKHRRDRQSESADSA